MGRPGIDERLEEVRRQVWHEVVGARRIDQLEVHVYDRPRRIRSGAFARRLVVITRSNANCQPSVLRTRLARVDRNTHEPLSVGAKCRYTSMTGQRHGDGDLSRVARNVESDGIRDPSRARVVILEEPIEFIEPKLGLTEELGLSVEVSPAVLH